MASKNIRKPIQSDQKNENKVTQLKILMLGQPMIFWEDKPLSIERKATRTLLYFLATQTKPVGRSTLCEYFWPSSDGRAAHSKLRSLLSKLRSSLPDPNCLISENDHVSLDFSQIYVDVHDYLSQYNALKNVAWRYPKETLLPQSIVDSLLHSESLWRGSHFLEETKLVSSPGLDNWLMFTNETLISARQLCLERVANHYLAFGEPDIAVKWLLELLTYDDLNPDLFHKILLALIRGGYRKEAEKVLAYLTERYESHTGKSIPEQIVKDHELFDKVFNNDQKSSPASWPVSLSINLPLIGRQDELNTLLHAFQKGGILVLKGEAGSGKTRLIKELYEQTWPNIRLLLANCFEANQDMPLQPMVEMLRSSINTEEWLKLSNMWANFLTLLVPDLTHIKPNLVIPERPVGPQGEGLIFEALLKILHIASEKQRTLFVLDDAQWSDVTSLSAIHYLVTHDFFKNFGLLLIAHREEQINKNLSKILLSLSRTEEIYEVALSGLSETDITRMASFLIQTPLNESILHKIKEDTGGNPYLVLETIEAIQKDSIFQQVDENQITLPITRNIQNLVNQRQSHLDTQSLECLIAAAGIGFDVDLDILRRVVSYPHLELEKCLKSLTLSGFLKTSNDNPGLGNTFQFTHNIERETILSSLNPAATNSLHLRIAQALEINFQNSSDAQASRIAKHYQLANNKQLAIKWWLLAARHAWNLYSTAATDQAYLEVKAAFDQVQGDISEDDAFTYFSQRALYLFEKEELDSLDHLCHVCLEWGQQHKSSLLIGVAFFDMSYATYLRKHYHEGLGFLEKAIIYLSLSDKKSIQAEAYIRKGILLAMVQRYEEAVQSFDSALDVARDVKSSEHMESLFQAHAQKSLCLYIIGKARDGLKEIEDAYDKYRYLLKPLNHLRAHYSLCNNLFSLGQYSDAYDHAEKGWKLAQEIGRTSTALSIQLVSARVEIRKGNLDGGLALVKEVIQKSKASNKVDSLNRAYGIIGEAFIHMEDFKNAVDVLRFSTYNPITTHAFYENQGRLAFALIRLGFLEEGETILETVLNATLQIGMKGLYIEASLFQAYLLFSRGDLQAVDLLIDDMADKAFSIGKIEICMLAKQLQLTAAGMLRNYEKLDAIQTEITSWSVDSNVPWSHLKIIPEWLKYTKKSQHEKAQQCELSLKFIKQIEPFAQSEDVKTSFENARARWTKGFPV